jgi:hypothetical protein
MKIPKRMQTKRGRSADAVNEDYKLDISSRAVQLRVWIRGGALFSYPSQVSVERLVIEDDGQPEALGCQWQGLAP